jgi:hypothetical protein
MIKGRHVSMLLWDIKASFKGGRLLSIRVVSKMSFAVVFDPSNFLESLFRVVICGMLWL